MPVSKKTGARAAPPKTRQRKTGANATPNAGAGSAPKAARKVAVKPTAKAAAPARKPATRAAREPAPAASADRAGEGYTTLAIELRASVALVMLNRPDVHNAFDETLIAELTDALEALDAEPEVRAVVLLGAGRSFCAGADLNWMRRMANYGRAENLADARGLAKLLSTLANLRKPTLARVHGNVFGGGVGLVACCDIAIGAHDAKFALSEARLGLIPATISPYVSEAIGARQARRYYITGERFEAAEAYRIGLLHDIVPLPELDARINEVLGELMLAGPAAQAEAKALVRNVAHQPIGAKVIDGTARHIAAVRASSEGREGVGAFLGKRKAGWVPAPQPQEVAPQEPADEPPPQEPPVA
jgi:methylglutaconyl-CoA hydratase